MPTINDRIGSQNIIRVLANASAPPTRVNNLVDVNSTRKDETGATGYLLIWDRVTQKYNLGNDIAAGINVQGISTFSSHVDFGEVNFSGVTTAPTLVATEAIAMGATTVITAARQLQNIASLDATTTATIEAAVTNAPNTFTDLQITGLSTFIGASRFNSVSTFNLGLNVATGVATFTPAVDMDGGLDVSGGVGLNVVGHTELDNVNISGVSTFAGAIDANGNLDVDGFTELDDVNVSGAITATTFTGNLAGTVNTAAQTNITSLGTLSAVTVSGDITANGNIVGDDSTNISGISSVTATTYYGDGSNLTGTGVETLISGITVKEESSTVGTAGSIKVLDFQGANITATASGSDTSVITVTGGGLWESNATGIHTLTNVGVGTTTASPATFTVNAGTAVTAVSVAATTGELFTITNNLTDGSIFSVNDVSGIPSIDVDADGTIQLAPTGTTEMVGIGTTNPTSKLHVVGDVNITGVITATAGAGIASATILTDAGIDPNGTSTFLNVNITGIATAADFNSSSDIKLKTNVQRISDPLDKIIRIEGVSFNWKKDNSPSIGVIANELEKVLPQLVTDSDPKAVNYNGLIGVLIEAVKEQQSEIDSLKERISKLE